MFLVLKICVKRHNHCHQSISPMPVYRFICRSTFLDLFTILRISVPTVIQLDVLVVILVIVVLVLLLLYDLHIWRKPLVDAAHSDRVPFIAPSPWLLLLLLLLLMVHMLIIDVHILVVTFAFGGAGSILLQLITDRPD